MITISILKNLRSPQGAMPLSIEVELPIGSFMTLYGPSGAGKTSLLRILAGLMKPDNGRISVSQQTWLDTNTGINLPPQKREVGFLFQEYSLFPNMTVIENLKFALKKGQSKSIIDDLLEIIELGSLRDQNPGQLSGGQKQRVALARSLVQRPKLLLLDEPLSALDTEMRHRLQKYIIDVHRTYNLTTIMVSHDISEIIKMSDRMLIIDHGRIIDQGKPVEVFRHKEVSGKFQFFGEVLNIEKEDFIYIVSILIGREVVKVVGDSAEVKALRHGDKVMVASKAFNPIIKKI